MPIILTPHIGTAVSMISSISDLMRGGVVFRRPGRGRGAPSDGNSAGIVIGFSSSWRRSGIDGCTGREDIVPVL